MNDSGTQPDKNPASALENRTLMCTMMAVCKHREILEIKTILIDAYTLLCALTGEGGKYPVSKGGEKLGGEDRFKPNSPIFTSGPFLFQADTTYSGNALYSL